MLGREFFLRGTFKLKYLEIEGTTVHELLKNIEVKKNDQEFLVLIQNNSAVLSPPWLLEPSQETDFVKARTSLYLTHCI